MNKKVRRGLRSFAPAGLPPSGDTCVASLTGGEPEPIKRLTFDVPERLHTAMTIDCAKKKVKVGHKVMAMLETKWGAAAGGED